MLKVKSVHNAFLVQDNFEYRRTVVDSLSYAIANLLAGNNENSPAIEILNGYIELEVNKPALIAVTGSAAVSIGGKREERPWRLIPVTPNSIVRIESLNSGIAYVSIPSNMSFSGRKKLSKGSILDIDEGKVSDLLDELPARRIPSRYIPPSSNKVEIKAELLVDREVKIPKLFVIKGKDPHSISLSPIGSIDISRHNVDSEPIPGSVIVGNPNVKVITNPSSDDSPIVAEIGPLSLGALARAPNNAIVKVKYSTSEEVKSQEVLREVELIDRIKLILSNACSAVRRGAKLVRVRVGESIFEAWVEEI
ncbi:MAG: hypothetical protein DRJ66_01845 [Thermoprotei archaeon]|nr:MAG: hypothetical protein DRJ66_01845 [Thermoprotei archaeon]